MKNAIQKSGTDLDDQTKGFLITQLHDANPAKEDNPSRPSSAMPTLSARHTTIEPYRAVLEGIEVREERESKVCGESTVSDEEM